MRKVIAVAIACLLLTGCTSPPRLTQADPALVAASTHASGAVPMAGDCLTATDGAADWTSSMPCELNHGYDVISVEEWPGMADALAASSADALFTSLTGDPEAAADYLDWAAEMCTNGIRSTIGWTDLPPEFADLVVLPAAPLSVETTIAGREDFVAGEHRTVCAVAWWEQLRYAEGISFADFFSADFPPLTRSCWNSSDDGSSYFTMCDRIHTGQSILTIDVAAAYGLESVVAPQLLSQKLLDDAADRCAGLIATVTPGYDPGQLQVWSMTLDNDAWIALEDDPPREGVRYELECGVDRIDGASVRGDLTTGGGVEVVTG